MILTYTPKEIAERIESPDLKEALLRLHEQVQKEVEFAARIKADPNTPLLKQVSDKTVLVDALSRLYCIEAQRNLPPKTETDKILQEIYKGGNYYFTEILNN